MEILLILAIILGIFMLPRVMSRNQEQSAVKRVGSFRPTGWTRLAIAASFVWPAGAFLVMQPWDGRWIIFLYVAVGPIALIWGFIWVFSGFLKSRH